MDDEIPLNGGRVTVGIVRSGSTVRRPIHQDRSLVHALLRHLEDKGFDATPRFLGIDDQNRETLTFLLGEVPYDLGHYTDAQLADAAALLRRFHDATADFPAVIAAGAEVICHNDWGSPNCVFRDGVPTGLIDFDTIAPGLRLWDLGYSAGSWLDLGNDDYPADEQARRLEVFAAGYGHTACRPAAIAAYALSRRAALTTWARLQEKQEMADWSADTCDWIARNLIPLFLPTGFPPP